MKRRTWLIGTGAVIGGALGVGVVGLAGRDLYFDRRAKALAKPPLLAGWIGISPDDVVTVYIPHSDMGQGSQTALAMMAAEELDAAWSQVRAQQAPADPAFANRYFIEGFLLKGKQAPEFARSGAALAFGEIGRLANMQVTGGSASVRFTGQMGLRAAGAAARDMLLQAAAAQWNVPKSELATRDGVVRHAASGKSARYGQLVQRASEMSAPAHVELKKKSEFRLIGTAPPRMDIPGKVNGSTKYGIDVSLPGMLVATVMASPVHGERLVQVDEAPALAVRGVRKVVKLPNAVAVVADGYWQARTALLALEPQFSSGPNAQVTSDSLSARFNTALESEGKKIHAAGDVDGARGTIVSSRYAVPFLHHATMEPINATAQWEGGKLKVWGSEQDALGARANLADVSGLSMADVEFTTMSLGGGFGRRSAPKKDHLAQVVALAKAMSPAPVKLIWSREEDFAQGAYRPAVATRIDATLDEKGHVQAWRQRFIDTPELINEGFPLPYAIANQRVEAVAAPSHVRYGAWRSVAHSQHGFFTESFMDELAVAAKTDPLEFRRMHLPQGSRHARVLDEAARRAGWGTPLPAGRARGIALVESFGSVVAEVIEASVDDKGVPKVHKVTAVVDCGFVVHRDTAAAQVQGGIVMGLSAALGEAITIKDGAVAQHSFPDYPILRMDQVPAIEIKFLESDGPLGGLGEVGLPPVAPALANAVYAATGKRVRSLPLRSVGKEASAAWQKL